MPAIDPYRPAVGGKLLDVKQHQSVVFEYLLHSGEREIGEVFVVDGVKLVPLHQPQQMGEFHRYDSIRFKKYLHPANEVVDIRNVGKYIVADEEVGLSILLFKRLGGLHPKESHLG